MQVMRIHMNRCKLQERYEVRALVYDGSFEVESRKKVVSFVEDVFERACSSKELRRHRLRRSPWGFEYYSYDPFPMCESRSNPDAQIVEKCKKMAREFGPNLLVASMESDPYRLCRERFGCQKDISFARYAHRLIQNALHDFHVFWCCLPLMIAIVFFPILLLNGFRKRASLRKQGKKEL